MDTLDSIDFEGGEFGILTVNDEGQMVISPQQPELVMEEDAEETLMRWL